MSFSTRDIFFYYFFVIILLMLDANILSAGVKLCFNDAEVTQQFKTQTTLELGLKLFCVIFVYSICHWG